MDGISENERLRAWAQERRLQRAAQRAPELDAVGPAQRDLHGALATARASLAVIAEPARRSLEEGHLRDDLDVGAFARACVAANVAAVAVSTDPRYGLRVDELAAFGPDFPLPVLLHDLVVDPAQLLEARALGADGIWLHVGALKGGELKRCLELAGELRMAPVVEVATEGQLALAVTLGAPILSASGFDEMGAQNSDAALELLRRAPPGVLRVVRGPVSGRAGLEVLRGEVDALWICGPASMPRDTLGYLRPLVAEADRG